MVRFLATFFGSAIIFLFSLSVVAQELYLFTTEEPPYTYTENGQQTGIVVDIVQALLEASKLSGQISFLPWKRALSHGMNNKNTAIFAAGRNQEREPFFLWNFPIILDKKRILARLKKPNTSTYTSLEQMLKAELIIGVINGDARTDFLKRQGYSLLDLTASHESNLRKLIGGRVDLITTSIDELIMLSKSLDLDFNQFETAYILFRGDLYLAINKDSDPTILRALRAAMKTIRQNGTLDKIARKWKEKTKIPFYYDGGKAITIGDL